MWCSNNHAEAPKEDKEYGTSVDIYWDSFGATQGFNIEVLSMGN